MSLKLNKTRDGYPEIEVSIPEKDASFDTAGLIQFATASELNDGELPTKAISPLVFAKGKAGGIAPLDKNAQIPFPFTRFLRSDDYPDESSTQGLWFSFPPVTEATAELVILNYSQYQHFISGFGIYTATRFQINNVGDKTVIVDAYIGETLIRSSISCAPLSLIDVDSTNITGPSGPIIIRDHEGGQIYVRNYVNCTISLQSIQIEIVNAEYVDMFIDNVGTYHTLNYTLRNNGQGIINVNVMIGRTIIRENVEMEAGKSYSYSTGQMYGMSGKMIVEDISNGYIYFQSEPDFAVNFEPVPVTITAQLEYNQYDNITSITYSGVQYILTNSSNTYSSPVNVYLGQTLIEENIVVPPNSNITLNTGSRTGISGVLIVNESESENRFYTGTRVWSLSSTQLPIPVLTVENIQASNIIDYDNGILYNGVECVLKNTGTSAGTYTVYLGNKMLETYTINHGEAVNFSTGTLYGVEGKIFIYNSDDILVYVSEEEYACIRDINEPWDGELSTLPGIVSQTNDKEWMIYTPRQLARLALNVNNGESYSGYHFTIMDDINLNNQQWIPIGISNFPFSGVFDGNNKAITNMYCEYANFSGLFGNISDAILENLTINNSQIISNMFSGLLVGNGSGNSTIIKCNIENSRIESSVYVGSLVGLFSNGTLNVVNCEINNTFVSGNEYVGGLIGRLLTNNDSISSVTTSYYNISDVNSNSLILGASNVGGILGEAENANIINCGGNNVTINGSTANVGGIIGNAINVNMKYPNANGSIDGGSNMCGGIAGKISSSNISKTNSMAIIINNAGSYTGGVVGYAISSEIYGINRLSSSIHHKTTSVNIGGIVGYASDSNIISCSTFADINGYYCVGGIAGTAIDSTINNCLNNGLISTNGTSATSGVGGIIGVAENTVINNSSATRAINSNCNYCGGLIGKATDCQLNNSVFSGTLANNNDFVGSAVGGIVNTIECNSVFVVYILDNVIGNNYQEYEGITKTASFDGIVSSSATGGNVINYWPINSDSSQIYVTIYNEDERRIDGLLGNSAYNIYF